jgi:serine protease
MSMRRILLNSAVSAVMCFGAGHGAAVELVPTLAEAQAAAQAAASGSAPTTAAAPAATPSRIRVRYRQGPQAAAASANAPDVAASIAQTSEARVQTRLRNNATEDLVLDRHLSEQELGRIAESLTRNPAVEWAVPETIERAQQANDPNDPFYQAQWHYQESGFGIRLARAWKQSTGKDVVVAVLDTGIRRHADIADQLVGGYDFVTNLGRSNDGDGRDPDASDPGDWCPNDPPQYQRSSWHGLHVAGTIAAMTNNGVGVAGVAPGVKILPVRVLGQCGGSNLDIADAILWAAGLPVDGVPANPHPARVINLSLGGMGPCDAAYADAIRSARQQGVTVVVSAGNSDLDASGFRPANCEGVISVAATNRAGARALFRQGGGAGSNFGASVKIAAPGGETYATPDNGVLSTMNDGIRQPGNDTYKAYQGTSMAAPHVAGVVALMYQAYPSISPDEVLSILRSTSQPFPHVASRQCNVSTCGAGIVDAHAAVAESVDRAASRVSGIAGSQMQGGPAPRRP